MILLGCEFCLFEVATMMLYGLPFVGPALVVWLRRRRKSCTLAQDLAQDTHSCECDHCKS